MSLDNLFNDIISFNENKISFEEVSKKLRKYKILPNSNNQTFTIRIPIEFGRVNVTKIKKIILSLPEKVPFIHITTKQNLEIQNLDGKTLLNVLYKLNSFGLLPFKESITNFMGVSYLTGINMNGIFDILNFAKTLARIIQDYVDISSLHPKFRIGISDSEEDFGLAMVSDIGLIARKYNNTKGFKVLIGGSLGEIPVRAKIIYEFVNYSECFYKALGLVLYLSRLGKIRFKNVISEVGLNKVLLDVEVLERDLKLNLNISNIIVNDNQIVSDDEDFSHGVNDFRIKPGLRGKVKILRQNQKDKFMIETILDKGDVNIDFLNFLCFVSSKFGSGEIIFTNRQNIIIPNLEHQRLQEIKNLLKIANIVLIDNHLGETIVACTGKYSCNIAIINTKELSDKILDEISSKLGIKINISGCPNSSGHHHLGDIGIFTISRHRNKTKVFNVLVFGGYGVNVRLPIGRVFAKFIPSLTPKIIKSILDLYKNQINIKFEEFILNNWVNLKKYIISIVANQKSILLHNFTYSNFPIREGSNIDKIFLTLFDIEVLFYKLESKGFRHKKMANQIVRKFIQSLPEFLSNEIDLLFKRNKIKEVDLNILFEIEVVIEKNIEKVRELAIKEVRDDERDSIYSR